jgi:WD40 repeat protein
VNPTDTPVQLPESPFPGILPFNYGQRDVFFGRESEARSLARLAAMYRGVLLYADSGTGKSSLVDAGLIPGILEDGFQPERVRIQPVLDQEIIVKRISLNPGGGPPYLPSIFGAQDELDQVVLSIDEFLQQVKRSAASAHPMLIFDQFEEWVTLFEDGNASRAGDERWKIHDRLAEAIAGLVLDQNLPVKVVIVFREDYLAKMDALFRLCPQLPDQYLRLGHLHSDQIADLIRQPYKKYPGQFKPEISDSLAQQIQEQFIQRSHGADPFLTEVQIVCLQLFSSGKDSSELEAYFQQAGGVGGIVEDYFEIALASLDEPLRDPAVGLLTRMVTTAGTRNVISEDDLINRVKLEDSTPESVLAQALSALEHKTGFIRHDLRRDTDYYELGSEFLVDWIKKKRDERLRQREQAKLALAQKLAEAERAQAEKFRKLYNLSVSQGLAAKALINMDADQERSLLLALEGVLSTYLDDGIVTPEAEDALRRAIQASRLKRTLIHPNPVVSCVAFSANGAILATGGEDSLVRLWDVFTGRLVRSLKGHRNWVSSLAYHPNGNLLASSSSDFTVRVWNPANGKVVFRGEHPAGLLSVVFSPDGKLMATCGDDGVIKLWETTGWTELRTLAANDKSVWDISFSPDGKRLASGGEDLNARLWDVESGELLFSIPDSDEIYGVAFSPDGHRLATCGRSASTPVKILDLNTKKISMRMLGQTNTVNRAIFSPDGASLAAVSYDRTTKVWDAQSGAVTMTLTGHTGRIRDAAFSPNGALLATAAEDGTARIWDFSLSQEFATLPGSPSYIFHFDFSSDGSRITLPDRDGWIKSYDVRTGLQVGALKAHQDDVNALVYSDNGRYLATASTDGAVKLWDADSLNLLHTFNGYPSGVNDLEFDRAGSRLATGCADGRLIVWDIASKHMVCDIDAHTDDILGVAISPDGKKLASVSEDANTYLWNADNGDLLDLLVDYEGRMVGVCFTPDGKYLITSGDDTDIWVWNVRSGNVVRKLSGHVNLVDEIAVSPDGKRLASVSWDRTTRLWDLKQRKELMTFYGHASRITSVAFSGDGRLLATVSPDNSARLYTLDVEVLLSLAWSRLTRTLTKDECRRFLQQRNLPRTMKAIQWIVAAKEQAALGKLPEAIASMQQAFKLLPGIRLNAEREARRMAADIWLEQGKSHAWNGDYESALFSFRKARRLDASIAIDPALAAGRLVAQQRVESGNRKLLQGDWAAAFEDYTAALQFSAAFAPEEVHYRVAKIIHRLADDGLIPEALAALNRLQALIPGLELPAVVYNIICWMGSLLGYASQVLFAGEKAVQIFPDPNYYDSRGLARALTGDFPGAIEDFQVFVDGCKDTGQLLNLAVQREAWIVELKAGRNPFDEATLRSMQ